MSDNAVFRNNRVDKTLRINIRWGVIFQIWCVMVMHKWTTVEGATAWDFSGYLCQRCGYFERAKPPWDPPWTRAKGDS